ncbi:hydroxyisourate hydrolase [Sediminibacterium sp.]|uniref:hydroxyisourate hydrolase n=1 Tax=Sediminibacterium sp. TaxID=1917865 RepID=UPI003F7050A2
MKKIFILVVVFLSIGLLSFAQESKFQLSSHILDISTGKPVSGVKITLSKRVSKDNWMLIEERNTDANGRVKDFLRQDGKDNAGVYKLTFHTNPYFKKLKQQSFYPFIEVVFELVDNEHYHVPITLSAFGYATYRGN